MTHSTLELPHSPAARPAVQVELRNAKDISLLTSTLEHRADELKKLAKRNEDEGYFREGRIISADAGAITEYMLPQIREQGEIEFADEETLTVAIANKLRPLYRQAVARKWDEDTLLAAVSHRVALFAQASAGRAYAAGLAARDHEPALLALQSIEKLRSADDL